MEMRPSRIQVIFNYILDNLFDIFTIAIAGYLVVRHQIKPFTADNAAELATGILAVLGLIAVSGIWDRNRRLGRIEKISEKNLQLALRYQNRKIRADDFFKTERELTEKSFSSATEILLSGITLTRTTREYMYVLGQRLVAGAHIRIMIADPDIDETLRELVFRDGDLTAEQYKIRLQAVEMVIKIIANTPGRKGELEIGYLPIAPTFGLVMLDPQQPHGICWVEIYHHRTTEPTANFMLESSEDQFWYSFFRQQYEVLWEICRVENLTNTDEHVVHP